MSINASLSSDGVEEVYTAPTLKEMCLYKCVTNKEILTKEVDEDMDGSEKLDWEKFRLKEPIQRELLEAVLEAGEKYMFKFTWKYVPVLAAIRMSQPDHLVKVHVSNAYTLTDCGLEFLISGGSVKSLDINGCDSLTSESLEAINKFGSKLVYLRIGDSNQVLPEPFYSRHCERSAFLRTPNLKTFILSELNCCTSESDYWEFLLEDFISNLENLQISRCGYFETLEFLEPAKNKLTSLTLSCCSVKDDVNAWASLFKLDKLRSLDLIQSSIGKALGGENVVQRLLTAMPNLTRLAVDPGLVKDIHMDIPIRGQGPVAKRLEFLGVMDNDAEEIRKAKLLANDVAYFGTTEGELRALEYYSTRLYSDYNWNSFEYKYSTLKRLLESLSEVAGTPACKGVVVINLFIQTFKYNGICDMHPELFSRILKKLLTADILAKLGDVLRDQFIGAIFCLTKKWSYPDWFDVESEPEIISNVVDIMTILDGELDFDHYVTLVPRLMRMGEIAMFDSTMVLDDIGMEDFKNFLRKAAQLLKKTVDRFPEEINNLWGISSVLVVITRLQDIIDYDAEEERNIIDLVEILSSMIASLRKLCLNSVSRRAAFHSAKGADIVMALLKEIMDGPLSLVDRDSFTLLAILKSILKDTNLKWKLSESVMIASDLEKLLLSVHSKWQLWKSSNADGDGDNTHCIKMKSIASMLKYFEKHPRFGYKSSAAVKEILMKLK